MNLEHFLFINSKQKQAESWGLPWCHVSLIFYYTSKIAFDLLHYLADPKCVINNRDSFYFFSSLVECATFLIDFN